MMNRLTKTAALSLFPIVLCPAALAQVAGSSAGLSGSTVTATRTETATQRAIASVDSLLKKGQVVRARLTLDQYFKSSDWELASPDDSFKATETYLKLDRKMKEADPCDVSLQKVEVAVENGDLLTAETHAKEVQNAKGATASHKAEASKALADIAQRRIDLAPIADRALTQAGEDLASGRYAAAKTALTCVARAGLPLSEEQSKLLDKQQLEVLRLEKQHGRAFDVQTVSLGAWQPGVVRREGGSGGGSADPAPAPAPAPTNETPASTETRIQPAETPAQPTTPPPSPAPTPAQDDVVKVAMTAQAGQFIAEGDRLMNEGRYSAAIEKYRLVSTDSYKQYLTAEQMSYVEGKITEAQSKMNVQPLGTQTTTDISLIIQRTLAEFNNNMAQAKAALEAGETRRATDLMAQSRLTVAQTRPYFSVQQYTDLNTQIDDMNRAIEESRNRIDAAEREATAKKRAEDATAAEKRRMEEKDRKINESIDRARALQMEMKYEEALQVVDQVLFLDPREPSGLILRDYLQANVIFQRFQNIQRQKGWRNAELRLDIAENMLPPKSIMEYPVEWPKKSFDRGELSAFYDSRENRETLAKIDASKIPATFNETRLADVMDFVQKLTNVDVDTDWGSLREINITEDTPVTLKMTQASARVVLDRIIQKISADEFSKAGWAVEDGILRVASKQALDQNTNLAIYDISDLLFEPGTYDEVPQIDLQSLLQQSQGGGGGGQSPFRDDQNDQERDREQELQRRRDRINLITEIITSNVDPEGWRDAGGEVGTIQDLNNSLIIRNTPRNHREIVGLLSKLREVRSMQINVETKFLLVNQSWFEQIGFDIDVVLNANNNQVRAARANDPSIQPGDFFNFGSDASFRGLQRQLIGQGRTTPGVVPSAGLNATRVGQAVVNPRSFSPVGLIQDSFGLANTLIEGDFASQVAGANPALGISGQFLDDIQVDFLIQATQADKRTVQLTAPRLTFTNGQIANIFVVTQQAFVSDLTPVVGDSAVGFDPTVAVASEGVTMLMEGVISSDRRYVQMNVDAGVGRIDGFAQQPVTAVAGGQLVNSADTQSFIQLPTITVTRVRTTVTVPDEGTVLLGGQRLITELEIETGVPVLSKIPILNRFFTNRISAKTEQTLLILVKPTVLITSEQEEKQFPGIIDQLSTGFR